jgi:hypothetical protein
MRKLTDEALKARARAMLVAMTEEGRWVYAIEPVQRERIVEMLTADGAAPVEEEAAGAVRRFEHASPDAQFVVFDHADLGVVLVEGHGEGAVPSLARILDVTGFVPQSHLWRTALDVGDPGAGRALKILAHMAIGWDGDWTDLFLLHLASPDPIARHEATLALLTATLVSRETAPALELLGEAQRRETFPKLQETMRETEALVRAWGGEAIDLAAVGDRTGTNYPPV